MSERIKCKDCKWFKKNEHDEKTIYYHCFSAAAAIDDFCFMPEKKEDAKSEFYAIGKIEAGDAVYVIARDEVEKMKEENKLLKEDIKRVVTTMKHHCHHFIALKLCDCSTNRMGNRGCVYKRSDGCDIADFIKKYDR